MYPKINKYNRLFLFFFLLAGLLGCTQKVVKRAEVPEDLIPRDTLVNIFVDLRLLDAVINYEQKRSNRKMNEINYYLHNSVLNKYGITREQFERSYTYYQADLKIIDEIYADAITQLSKLKSKIELE